LGNRPKTVICYDIFLFYFVWRNLLSYTKVTERSYTDGRDDAVRGIHLSARHIHLQLPPSYSNQPKAFITSKGSYYWHWCEEMLWCLQQNTGKYAETFRSYAIITAQCRCKVCWHMKLFSVVLVILKKEKQHFPVLLNVLSLVHIIVIASQKILAVQTANSYWVTSRTIWTTRFKFWCAVKTSFFCFGRLVWNVGNLTFCCEYIWTNYRLKNIYIHMNLIKMIEHTWTVNSTIWPSMK
jgi:hypothetical protein